MFGGAIGRALDVVWPRRCAAKGCGKPVDRPSGHFCSACLDAMPWFDAGGACKICGAPVPAATRHEFVCEVCAKSKPAFEKAVNAMRFLDAVREAVLDFKFHNATHLAHDLAEFAEAAVRSRLDFAQIDVVMPVPIHPARLRERGYNQSALVAERLAENLGRRHDGKSLARVVDTEHQTRVNSSQRRQNLRHAFAVRPGREGCVRGRTILLVDDVMTTGSTLNECAKPLVKCGARRVWCVTVARSV